MRQSCNKYIQYLLLLFFVFPLEQLAAEQFSVATIVRPPFVEERAEQLSGFSIELFEEISRRSAIDFEWKKYKSFSDMVKDTVSGDNDLAIANISITSEREMIADFSQPIFESGMGIGIKKDAQQSFLSLIWDSGIILFLAGALFILLVIAHILWFFERNITDARHDYFRDDYLGGLWDAFWWAFIVMTMGGFEKEVPHKKISRILAMFWIVVSLFFISTLTAKITTALTVAELKSGIESYHDLAGKRVGVTSGSSHQKYLSEQGIQTIGYESLEEIYRDLKQDNLEAVVADLPILSYYTSHQGVSWMTLAGEPFNLESFGILMPQKSPLVETINVALLQLREDGYYDGLLRKYFGQDD